MKPEVSSPWSQEHVTRPAILIIPMNAVCPIYFILHDLITW
jgi:hypothetical protein